MKQSGPIKRKKALKRSTKIRKVNPTAKAKRVAKQKKHYASSAWKLIRTDALDRANHRCEYVEAWGFPFVEAGTWRYIRCKATTDLQVHHKTYARFGGEELPDDLQALCPYHHRMLEATLRPWNKGRGR